jgi:hypothetical protein
MVDSGQMDSLWLFAGAPSSASHAEFPELFSGFPEASMGCRKPAWPVSFHDLKHRGYTGSLSHLQRLLAKWRHPDREETAKAEPAAEESRAIDPATGWQISPIVAAALCMKPSKMLTPPQAVKVAALKEASPGFVIMRQLAMRFRSLFRGSDPDKHDP